MDNVDLADKTMLGISLEVFSTGYAEGNRSGIFLYVAEHYYAFSLVVPKDGPGKSIKLS